MATSTGKVRCFVCNKEISTYKCGGCAKDFCFIHLTEHRQTVSQQFDDIENDRNLFLQLIVEQKEDPKIDPLIQQIDKWEEDSIKKIKQTTEECKQMLLQHTNKYISEIEIKLNKLTEELKGIRAEDEFNEIDLNQIKTKLTKLAIEFDQPPIISIQQDSSSFINKISVIVSSEETTTNVTVQKSDQEVTGSTVEKSKANEHTNMEKINPMWAMNAQLINITSNAYNGFVGGFGRLFSPIQVNKEEQFNSTSTNIDLNTKCKQNVSTIAGGNEQGNGLNQLSHPLGIYVDDDDQTIYIADCENHRIVAWKCDLKNGQVVAGGRGEGNQTDQLNYPVDVIVDKVNDLLIISDKGNRRVMRWSRQNNTTSGETIISDIDCCGVAMDKNGSLYVSDWKKNEVRRWGTGESSGTIVAGGNGQGDHLNQLNWPTFIFVDEDYSVYVSDKENHRVMKWMKDAKAGIVVAGGQGVGDSLTQLCRPQGVIVDQLGHVYVADSGNDRVMSWCKGAKEGNIVVGGNREGKQSNQFNGVRGMSFDRQDNLYVVDRDNHRIQKFEIESN